MENGKYTRMVECMSKEQQLSITKSYICLQTLKELKDNIEKYDWNKHESTINSLTKNYPYLKQIKIKCHQ
jgi:hypothetical protein